MNYNYELEFHYKDENQDPIYLTHTFPGMDTELYDFIKSEFSDDIDNDFEKVVIYDKSNNIIDIQHLN
jgi:hypothetical protein